MRWFCPSVGIVLMMSATVGLAQESLCSPCVDPPAYRSPVQEVLEPRELNPASELRVPARLEFLRRLQQFRDQQLLEQNSAVNESDPESPVTDTEQFNVEDAVGEADDLADE